MSFKFLVAAAFLAETSARLLRQPPVKLPNTREEACRFCYRQCPISCFVGTCGLEYGFSVRRYQSTNQCFSCDASSSVGINKAGDFTLCSADEAAASSTYIKRKDAGPSGPGVSGDARAAAQQASDAASQAVKSAQLAAQKADEAAMAATARFRNVNAASGKAGDAEQMAQAHQIAMQIRAEELRKAMEAAQTAREISEKKYNEQLFLLRKQQIRTDSSEEVVERAEKASEQSRTEYTKAMANAAQAAQEGALSGAAAAGQAAEQAEAEELAAAARAAQRRAIIAAKSAKDAADKANIAAQIARAPEQIAPTLPPCNPNLRPAGASLLQLGSGAPCALTQQQYQSTMTQQVADLVASDPPDDVAPAGSTPSVFGVPDGNGNPAPNAAAAGQPSQEALADASLDTKDIDTDGSLDGPDGTPITNEDGSINREQLMSQELTERLSENPNLVNDPSVWGMGANPSQGL